MPAKEFIEKFKHDADTFDFEKFKEKMLAEINGDDDLNNSKITDLTEKNTTLDKATRDLKVSLWDATIAKQGTPVTSTDSAAVQGGSHPAPPVPDADIFG